MDGWFVGKWVGGRVDGVDDGCASQLGVCVSALAEG